MTRSDIRSPDLFGGFGREANIKDVVMTPPETGVSWSELLGHVE
jgi:hypothetical protein